VKIEPSSRPDGLRYGDGDDGSGNAPMFVELNKSKEIADIDLRYCSEGGEFHQLLRSADIVITSLSPRANANLGITTERLHAVNPDLALLSITAFAPEVNESDWVAYGTGVHAASGMGWLNGCPLTPAFSYPDPLAGLEACATAIAQLAGNAPKYRRVSLDRSVAGLKRSP
jgi:crotonobetainyl-CoA:carnitine CoA-transferase CaiB-like acyl-CoA transferase